MGVLAFYGWLVNKYSKIVMDVVEKTTEEHDDDGSPPKNPNGIEFDNLYLDMNGIIYPCFHPEYDDLLLHQENTPVTFDEVFKNIFDYIDRIMIIVKPRKLLYMAIDGVAPRAKMNQQRTRRFRNAKDQDTLRKEEDRLRRQYEIEGKDVLPIEESEVSDSNVVSPGTEFMYELSKQLQTYIRQRITNHPEWKQLKVILSDASSPGEGEHKIMSFIRLQRTCKDYNPNTRHVLYGLDADLIMLALATHEVHFSILRENVFVKDNYQPSNSSMTLHSEDKVVKVGGWFKNVSEQISNLEISTARKQKSVLKKPYQFLHVWILRDYLKLDLKLTNMPEKFEPDFERLIDDFIFICFFAGNDFLPHMPTLEIHEGAVDLLIHVYKEEFKNLGGYLVDVQRVNDKKGGYIKLKRVEKFILGVGAYEDRIFEKRSGIHESKLRRFLSFIQEEGNEEENLFPVVSTYSQKSTGSNVDLPCSSIAPGHNMQIVENTKMLKEKLKSYARKKSGVWRNGPVADVVKFGSPGWRKRYYKNKFSAETDDDMEKVRNKLVEKYAEGLCWVLLYYFSGVPSWTWFFPYHYGPFASDFKGLSSTKVMFQKGLPFKPFDQLMAVLPPTSSHVLPLSYQQLMTDEESSILDFYPSDFDTDTDGKRFLWQAICKLPFIDEERLLAATKKIEKELGEEEAKRNTENVDRLFLHSSENFASQIMSTFNNDGSIEKNSLIKIDTGLSKDINGFDRPTPEPKKDDASTGLTSCHDVLCLNYDPPCFGVHVPRVLEGTTIPETIVSESDIEERQLWHNIQGYQGKNNRSINRTEGSNRNTSISFKNSCPDVITKGVGNGWSGRGRGKAPQSSLGSDHVQRHEATRTSQEQTRGQSWWDTHTRGRGSQQGNRNGCFRSTNYSARTDSSNGQFWSVQNDSGRGRCKVPQSSLGSDHVPRHEATRTPQEQTRGQSWRDTNTRGRGSQQGNKSDYFRSSNYPARTNSSNGQFWSVQNDSGNDQASRRW